MTDATTFRLDTVDIADEFGWQIESTRHTDEFSRDGIRIEVQYTSDDDIDRVVRRDSNNECEVIERTTAGKVDLLRSWLAGQPLAVATRRAPHAQKPLRSSASDARRARPKLKWYHNRTGSRARKGIIEAAYAEVEDGTGRYEIRGTATNFTAVFVRGGGTEEILAGNVSHPKAYSACIRHYYD